MTIPQHILTQVINLIEARIGLSASTLSRVGLQDIITQMMDDNAISYLQTLRTHDDYHPSWQRLIHALTIGETYFLRDKTHFRILRETILPRLIFERRQQDNLCLNIWCLGASTGEEPYSVAITLREMIPDITNWEINLYATDVNAHALAIARTGHYRDWSFRQTPEEFRQRYFTQNEDLWQVDPEIQAMVTFQQMNALNGIPASAIDILFARHVLMYFSPANTKKVESNIYRALVNGGWLLMGQAESLHSHQQLWQVHPFSGTPIYQKLDPSDNLPEPISYPTREIVNPFTAENTQENDGYQQAMDAMHHDLPDTAEQHALAVLTDYPDHAKTHILLGAILANRQHYDDALKRIETALSISGLSADAHYIKGLILLEQDQEEDAIQSFHAAIYCERNHALAGLILGNIYAQRKDTARATRNWRNALRAVEGKSNSQYISDISDMTVARLRGMISKQQSLLDISQNPTS